MKNGFIQRMLSLWKEFLPLSMSDVTMALGDPMVNGALAQMPNIKTNLAALGVIKSIAVLFESPIIMVLHASNTLASKEDARKALAMLVFIACLVLTTLLGILALPFCFFPFMEKIVGVSNSVAKTAYPILCCLLLWPASIAIRRYFQGILIAHGKLKIIARAGFIRLGVLFFALCVGYVLHVPANILAGGSLMIALACETGVIVFAGRGLTVSPRDTPSMETSRFRPPRDHGWSEAAGFHGRMASRPLKEVWHFYWPLAHSMILVWGGRALLIVCLARAIDGSLALAIWPLTWSLVILFANATRMIQQVIIRNKDFFHPFEFIFFALSVGTLFSTLILFISSSTIGHRFLVLFCSQDPSILTAVKNILLICSLVPILVALQNVLQGFLMSTAHTKAINRATLCGTAVLLLCACIGVNLKFFGATVAAYSMVLSLLIEILILAAKVPWKIFIYQYLQQQNIQEGV